jgi:peptidoglycan/xylan/chitin deacetylase (PgdA/CDA1 family)
MFIALGIILIVLAIYWLFMSPTSQIFGKFPSSLKTKQKIVYLTFDDGPNEPYTSQIVDFLNSKDIKATFFVVGNCALRHPEVLKKIHKTGHTIGNHTKSHKFINYFKTPSMKREITENQEIIKNIIGVEPKLFRPPWLFRNPILLKNLKALGLQPVSGVFCHELEVFQIPAISIARRATSKAKPGQIIIFHDGFDAKGGDRKQTVEAVKLTVESLTKRVTRSKNFNLVTYGNTLYKAIRN